MKIFGRKSDDSRTRRSARVLLVRLRRALAGAVVLSLVAAGGVMLWRMHVVGRAGDWASSQFLTRTAAAGFRVKDIVVTGRTQVNAEDILAHLSIKKDMPIFGVDIAQAQKSLNDISWVKNVSISRRLPDEIIVALEERRPAALWQFQKKLSLIDDTGVVLADENLGAWKQLPLVVGEDAPAQAGALLSMLAAEPVVANNFVSATRVGGRRWDLYLKNGLVVRLPERDMELALHSLVALQENKNVFGREISAIDLRQSDRLVLTAKTTKKTST